MSHFYTRHEMIVSKVSKVTFEMNCDDPDKDGVISSDQKSGHKVTDTILTQMEWQQLTRHATIKSVIRCQGFLFKTKVSKR